MLLKILTLKCFNSFVHNQLLPKSAVYHVGSDILYVLIHNCCLMKTNKFFYYTEKIKVTFNYVISVLDLK